MLDIYWASQVVQWERIHLQCRRCGFSPWGRKIPWRKKWHPTPVLLPGEPHGQRSLEGCSPWGHCRSDMTERLHFHFSLSCIGGEGTGNPLQCSCLENPRDGGAWWAAIYGVAQNRTWLKRLSSSSSSRHLSFISVPKRQRGTKTCPYLKIKVAQKELWLICLD